LARQHRYNRPFQGAPSALPLSGLFLFSPYVDMKLLGKTMRGVLTDEGKESLFKRLERLQREEHPSAVETLRELLKLYPDSPFNHVIESALNGNDTAQAKIDSMGLWEVFLYDKWAVPDGKLSHQGAFILEIERACKEPMRLVRENQAAKAASLLAAHPVMCQFLWPDALDIFSAAQEPLKLLPLQASVALEIRLSLVALVDVTVSAPAPPNADSRFSCLVPSIERQDLNPTSLFFRWLKKEVDVETIDGLLAKVKAENGRIDTTTLKRWSNGSHQPNQEWLRILARDVFDDDDHEPLWNMYWASRYLNFIGYFAETLCERASGFIGTAQQHALAPWPKMPFGCDSITSWFETRYPVWLTYHRNHLAAAN
jgi:hypothetical protein